MELSAGPRPDVVDRLLRALPDWFGIESSIVEYVDAARRLPTILAHGEEGEAVGVLLYEKHFPETVEVHLMAVDPAWHRRGIGAALVAETERLVRVDGARLLTVKTLGPSRPSKEYDGTRRFYAATGFLPVEEFLDLWPANPCLLMAKQL